ncbi:hypothetical protein [Parafrankia sp. FMc2]|uniref:hypothetical protein n=1 Tax=Parafrankia sp. FMc2 TaxID=3233196 RepID=UPI0034D6230A
MLSSGHLVQGAEAFDLGGVGAHDDQPGLGVEISGGPAAADPGIESDGGHVEMVGQVS